MRSYNDNNGRKFPFARRASKETRVTEECVDKKLSWEDTVQQVEVFDIRLGPIQ
jgi:hypothetical protein